MELTADLMAKAGVASEKVAAFSGAGVGASVKFDVVSLHTAFAAVPPEVLGVLFCAPTLRAFLETSAKLGAIYELEALRLGVQLDAEIAVGLGGIGAELGLVLKNPLYAKINAAIEAAAQELARAKQALYEAYLAACVPLDEAFALLVAAQKLNPEYVSVQARVDFLMGQMEQLKLGIHAGYEVKLAALRVQVEASVSAAFMASIAVPCPGR